VSRLPETFPAESRGDASDVTLGDAVDVAELVIPGSAPEVADVVRWAAQEGRTVLPVGTGRHLHRMVAAERAVVLRADRLGGIRIYEPADLTLTAGAGTPLSELRAALAPHDQWLPFDPPDVDARTLGGLVAAGLSGPLAAGYGRLRNHVLGATAVLGDGRVVHLGGRVVKNVAGFDLLRPLVGSMGGLAVLTEICLRLFPVPHTEKVLVKRGDASAELVDAALGVARASVMPVAAVLVGGLPKSGGRTALLVRLHGASSSVRADRRTFEDVMGGPVEVLDGLAAAEVLRVARDHPGGGPSTGTSAEPGAMAAQDVTAGSMCHGAGVASALPARLGDVLAALESTLGTVPFSSDVMAGTTRFAFSSDQAPDLVGLRRALEGVGGSLGIEQLPDGADVEVGDAVSSVGAGEAALAARVRAVFDPPGVFWRARESRPAGRPSPRPGGSG
jgi:FAD/FMN-containing dehydrogenase